MILYLTSSTDGYLRLHNKIPGNNTFIVPFNISVFWITERELKERYIYLPDYRWWRSKKL